jgi:hypothetical protein
MFRKILDRGEVGECRFLLWEVLKEISKEWWYC